MDKNKRGWRKEPEEEAEGAEEAEEVRGGVTTAVLCRVVRSTYMCAQWTQRKNKGHSTDTQVTLNGHDVLV